ncbi:hypothetical protein F66182_16285 [Fusarium sp. NRRL 66182]|nr:hypothetical protein F66182_16285 [Fusarium sp. NRRL 66182]
MSSALIKDIIEDLERFLRPETKLWHNQRGIPYRYGILFEGPPGTGKTSLCIALAGRFKLKIFILNLSNITDSELQGLMSSLPEQCILLLEDIDSQKITNVRAAEPDAGKPLQPLLTLSGLLNAIDGVTASEGRILIMTTNLRDKLDDALTRPGRVDKTITFELPDSDGIKRLFFLMYSEYQVKDQEKEEETEQQQRHASPPCRICPALVPSPPGNISHNVISNNVISHNVISQDEIQALADQFAELLPEKKYSQARILNYLKKHSGKPKHAVEKIEELLSEKN